MINYNSNFEEFRYNVEKGLISIRDISDADIKKLIEFYKNEIENNKKEINITKVKISNLKNKISNII